MHKYAGMHSDIHVSMCCPAYSFTYLDAVVFFFKSCHEITTVILITMKSRAYGAAEIFGYIFSYLHFATPHPHFWAEIGIWIGSAFVASNRV